MDFALIPNLKVLIVSDTLSRLGEHVITSVVFELPPSDSESILNMKWEADFSDKWTNEYLVSFESL